MYDREELFVKRKNKKKDSKENIETRVSLAKRDGKKK